jgi:multidrug efflux system membrane fusion protein
MRIFPLLAAIAVSALMYMAIFERDALLGLAQGAAQPPAPAVDADSADTASPSDVAEPARVKVVVQRSAEAPLASAVIVRGQTTAARQVAVSPR